MIWEVSVALGTGVLSLLGMHAHNRRRLDIWHSAVAACSLPLVEISGTIAWKIGLLARSGPLEVQIEDARELRARITVLFPGPPGFNGVRIRHESAKPEGAREIEVGDEAFDERFFVEGPARLVTTMLDAEVRRLLLDAGSRGDVEIGGGRLVVKASDASLPDLMPVLVDLSRRLMGQSLDASHGLAGNARHDPEPGVRLRSLNLLLRELPGEPITAETLRAACADPSPEVRLRAATELGEEGRDILLELAENADGRVEDTVSAAALALLKDGLSLERTRSVLIRALRRRSTETARACLEALGRSGAPAAVEVLTKVMTREKGELAVAAARALAMTRDAAAEPPLLAALGRDNAALRVAAAEALARAGSSAAVLPLKEAAERFSRDRELRRAARQAVAEIQSRVQGASPGQLSLARTEAGHLSFATDPGGQVSFPET